MTLSGLPVATIERDLAAVAIAGTIIANMLLKMFVAAVYARKRSGWAVAGLAASTVVLAVSVGFGLLTHLKLV